MSAKDVPGRDWGEPKQILKKEGGSLWELME